MRPIDADALKELFSEVIGRIAIKPEMNGNLEHMIRASAMVIQMIDDAPTVQPEQRWVPCSERLPEDFKKVLVFWWEHSEPMIDTAFWQKDAKRFDGQHWVRIEDKITHWMPLPEPYQEGEKE